MGLPLPLPLCVCPLNYFQNATTYLPSVLVSIPEGVLQDSQNTAYPVHTDTKKARMVKSGGRLRKGCNRFWLLSKAFIILAVCCTIWCVHHIVFRSHFCAFSSTSLRTNPLCRDFRFVWGDAAKYAAATTLLKRVTTFLEAHGQKYALIGGALLGMVRHNGSFVPWDDDVDLYAQHYSSLSALPKLIEGTSDLCYGRFWKEQIKIYRCDSPVNREGFGYPSIDIQNLYKNAYKEHGIQTRGAYNDSVLWPSKWGTLEGVPVRIPFRTEEHLMRYFGREYKEMCYPNVWSHEHECRNKLRFSGPVRCVAVQDLCGALWSMK
jgi:hypothetical protein